MKTHKPILPALLPTILSLMIVAFAGCSHHNDHLYDISRAPEPAEQANVSDSQQIEDKIIEPDTVTLATARSFMQQSEAADKYARGIIPGILEDAPDYAVKLLNSDFEYFIVVDKASMNVLLFNKYGEEVKAYKMACAKKYGSKHARRDSRTPEGFFTVQGIYDSTDWLFTDDDGNTSDVKGQFGPRFIRLKTPVSSQIGIHGTCSPWALGGRRSHGCIRIHNDNILDLVNYAKKGMPVIVNPGPKDKAVNDKEGYFIPIIRTGHEQHETGHSEPSAASEAKPDTIAAYQAEPEPQAAADSIIP